MPRLFAAGSLAAVAACAYLPAPAAGVPSDPPWTALPLKAWIAEGETRAEGIGFCDEANCPTGTVVGRFVATGEEARSLLATLQDPERLKASLDAAERRERPDKIKLAKKTGRPLPATVVTVRRVGPPEDLTVAVTVARRDGSRTVAGIIRGTPDGDNLDVTIATGRSFEALAGVIPAAKDAH